ncbi:hypothetical protein AGABI1DRAFT_115874 [Agaricus bisporus var. burnettii JB137-S8]|uniref:YDG domain-containing protein n=1 Tax=Agaricus bisporus var. burnettii (strain JB137-S8 / ATCC MYA-4627 / FGSC 10392) TaxID=597362 RepID=K5X099_AGABU|nr:uncharacterized protein AGABI1DRAFT_115874 [Agaricus bisporus var. burnettii JB137-S8]EKM76302.1 hypothetical protein AGABI1DRAFT_115874 [Agaricus bisporus var. burnettii JB137-S8]
MAMERLRRQIMQNDQSGAYRFNDDTGSATQIASPKGGDFLSSEASAADHYGHPDKCPVGRIFESRKACYDAKVHRAPMKGILGTVSEGAYSIVMNDGYEDDVDEGDVVYYTGAGGQDNFGSSVQIKDQSFDHLDNRTLQRNIVTKHPVRVIRGSKNTKYGPFRGYRYDGLYDVVHADYAKGKRGYQICRFKLQRRPGQLPLKDLPRM